MIAEALAAALVARFDSHVPEGATMSRDGDMIIIVRPATQGWIGAGLDVPEGASDEAVARAAHSALRALQEFIVEQLRRPWPGTYGGAPSAIVRGKTLHLFYGEEGAPALALPPIDLEQLRQ